MFHAHALLLLLASLGGESRGEVLDFTATWCGPCQQMSPIVSRLEREGLPIRKVDVEQERALAQKYNVQSIPTFLLVVDGEEVTRIVGQTSEAELRRLISRIPPDVPKPRDPPFLADAAAEGTQSMPRGTVTPPVGDAPAGEPEKSASGGLINRLLGRDSAGEEMVARGNNEEAARSHAPATGNPMSASTRIRVTINGRVNLGSGTVVDSRSGRTLIVTCGHIFRDFDEASKVEVDLFSGGTHRTFVGTVFDYDLDADVGLIAVPTDSAVSAVPVAAQTLALAQGEHVACIGCSGGNDPTREQLTVTAINKYDGPDNIECTGTPVQGRSGGGLFNSEGELVGVCIAADQKANRGLYAHAFAIHRLLDECKLTYLYNAPVGESDAAPFIADAATEAPPADFATESPFGGVPADESAFAESATIAMETPATDVPLDGAVADVSAGDAEVVVIIRPRNQPNASSRVVVINQPSSKFYAFLNGELSGEQPASSLTARRMQTTTQTVAAPETASPRRRATTADAPAARRAAEQPMRNASLRPTSLSRDAAPRPYVRSAR